jgi:hypothetical protein
MLRIQNIKKILLITVIAIFVMVAITILFISPLTKYLIEKYDVKYTGRKITLGWVYANPFTGYIHLNQLNIFELKSDSVFFSAESMSINISLFKIFSKTYEITEFTLDHPRGTIIQYKSGFNFTDILNLFHSKSISDTNKAAVHLNIYNIKIINGNFYYREPELSINYNIKNVNIESTGKKWDTDTIHAQFSFVSGIGTGNIKGDFTINLKNNDYRYAVAVNKFDLNIIEQYLRDLTNYGSFSANLDANIKSKGNLNDAEDLTTSGTLQINNFHFGKNPVDDYASFKKLVLVMNELSPKKHIYLFDSLLLLQPYFKYELYDYLDNFQTVFGENGTKLTEANSDKSRFNLIIEIANYIKILARNFFHSYYKINRFEINKGDLKFNDYSISELFSVDLNPLTVIADSIDKNHDRINVSLKSGIKPYGEFDVSLSVNPKDTGDFDMQYQFQKFPASLFNPYTITYTSFPLDRGTIEVNGTWNVRNGIIKSVNHLVIIDPRVTKRLKNKDTKWMPLPLIMSFIRERGNVIDYEIPITGNLKNPKFHLHDIISDVVKNIFVKPATTAYRQEVKNIESEIENSLTLKWEMKNCKMTSTQEIFLDKMSDFLVHNPNASITVSPQLYATKEKEYILFLEAKKIYYTSLHKTNIQSFTENDSEIVNKMGVKDSLFVEYLNKLVNDSMVFTNQERCARIIEKSTVNIQFRKLNKEREKAFLSFFEKRNVKNQVSISAAEYVIPYNGFSFYKIKYKGELPESLIKAYRQMHELNEEAPRDKFKKERKKNKIDVN